MVESKMEGAASSATRSHDLAIACGLFISALAAWLCSLPLIDLRNVNGIGFAGAFSPLTWLALFLDCGLLTLTVYRINPGSKAFWRLAIAGMVLLVSIIHGTPALLESAPRFFEAYTHVGFTEYIYRTGEHSAQLNSRLSWFSSFGLASTLFGSGGSPSWLGAVRLSPWVFNLAVLMPIYAIAARFIEDKRARVATLIIFIVGDWIAQDYFSPQAFCYFITMCAIAVIVNFAPLDRLKLQRIRELRQLERTPWAVLAVLMTLTLTAVISHQLSPVALLAFSLILVLWGATSLRVYPVATAAAILTYLSVGGYSLWAGNLAALYGVRTQTGKLGGGFSSLISQNLTDRLRTGGLDLVVSSSRVGLSLVVLALAFIGFLMGRRKGTIQLFAALAAIPFVFLVTTGYGGEALLRAFFFSLPFSAALIASLVSRLRPGRKGLLVIAAALSALGMLSEIARYGNEQFERVSSSQLTIVQDLLKIAPSDSRFIIFGKGTPIDLTGIDHFKVFDLAFMPLSDSPSSSSTTSTLIREAELERPDFVIWSPEQAGFATHARKYPEGWDQPILRHWMQSPDVRVLVDRPDIKIISFDRSWHPPSTIFSNVR